MPLELNCDAQEIKNWEVTPEGYMKLWMVIKRANHDLIYNKDGKVTTEFMSKSNLMNKDSINSAIGKHVTFNHPPQAITSNNWREHSVGVALQEVAEDGDNLLMATMIYDQNIIDSIKSGKIKYTSSGYSAVKLPLNQDGKIEQTQVNYNHFALLDENHTPRAGETSKVMTFGLPNADSKNNTNMANTSNNTDNSTEDRNKNFAPKNIDVGELIQLHTNWDSLLASNGKSIDYNMDAVTLKRQVLECYYPPAQIARLNDANLDGFWINFELNKDIIESNTLTRNQNTQQSSNNDAANSPRNTFIATLEGRK